MTAIKYNVRVAIEGPYGTEYAVLEDNGRQSWCKRVAQRKAREWKADNMRDAFIEEASV